MTQRSFDAARIAGDIVTRLRAGSSAERREHTAGYFPTSMEILGASVPLIRAVAQEYARALGPNPPAEMFALIRALLATRAHEARQAAYEIIAARPDVTRELNAALIRELGECNDNWASVDAFSVLVAGHAWRDGLITDAEVMSWAASSDVWWRRTALASTIPLNARSRGGQGSVPRTLRVCRALVDDRHPMIVKALSWALRELIPHDAHAVAAFVAAPNVAAQVKREVGNKLRTGTKSGRAVLPETSR